MIRLSLIDMNQRIKISELICSKWIETHLMRRDHYRQKWMCVEYLIDEINEEVNHQRVESFVEWIYAEQ